jgi:cytochrome c oxidase subunit 3
MVDVKKTEANIEAQRPSSMHPKKFALWLFMVTVVMLFAAFTSAYLVRRDAGDWLIFQLPSYLLGSTIIILISSATMHLAYLAAKKDNFATLKLYTALTFVLGITFLIMQVMAWGNLVEQGVYLGGATSNPAGSFVYVFTILHGVHLISGVFCMIWVLVRSFQSKIHSKKMLTMDLCATYWHFLGLLWVYLYVFLLINN